MKLVLIVLILTFIMGLAMWMNNRNQKPQAKENPRPTPEDSTVVIGQQMAAAQKREEQRLKTGAMLPSPLPDGMYAFVSGQLDLVDPKPVDFDRALRQTCGEFRELPPAQRDLFRRSVSKDEFYKLLDFARRSAVFALREKNREILQNGFTALTMIESDRVDFRDLLVAISLLYHASNRLDGHADALTTEAAGYATPEVAAMLIGFARRNDDSKDLKKSWGLVEIGAGPSLGFADWESKPYRPTLDLLATARDLAMCIDQDDYCALSVALGSDVPTVWLKNGSDDSPERLLKSTKGAVSLTARLKSEKNANWLAQQFSVFLAELDDASSAAKLAELSRAKSPAGFCRLGVVEGRLFCLIVARSWWDGVAPYEKGDSLERFRARVTEILAKHSRANL